MIPADATCSLRTRHMLTQCNVYCMHALQACIPMWVEVTSCGCPHDFIAADMMRVMLRWFALVLLELPDCVQAPYLQVACSVPAHGDKSSLSVSPTAARRESLVLCAC